MRRQVASSLLRCASAAGVGTKAAVPCLATSTRLFADDASLKKTPLYDFHVEHGGKMVPFAGWSMPIQYKDSIIDSTLHCRNSASLFDVSHMCGVTLKGKDAIPWIEKLVVGDIAGLKDGTGTLSVLTNESGGIIDDTIVTRIAEDELYLVLNAGCRDKDLAHLRKHLDGFSGDLTLEVMDDKSLLALQGPQAVDVLQPLVKEDLSKLYFGSLLKAEVKGVPCYIARSGYTGEDGFELSIPADRAVDLATAFVSDDRVRLCGLGPRDSLRLEAGLCLYGNDLNEGVTPVEAGLTWTIGKRRREDFSFLGGEVIKRQLADGVKQRRVGLLSSGPPARQHSPILDGEGRTVGEISSGAHSPCLKKNVAMGYVEKALGKAGTELKVVVRGKPYDAVVAKMPFVPNRYYKGA
ncbi:GCST1 [Auxenochlorella protothecoides x Auxenochlorella symbiontica]